MRRLIVFFKTLLVNILLLLPVVTGYAEAEAKMRFINMENQKFVRLNIERTVSEYLRSLNSPLTPEYVVDVCLEEEIDITFVLSQGLYESHLGTRGASKKTYSVWGVGAYDNGKHISYESPDDSLQPYIRVLKGNYLSGKTQDELMMDFSDSLGRRYSSNPNYEINFRCIYRDLNKRTKLDSLQSEYYKYKLLNDRRK